MGGQPLTLSTHAPTSFISCPSKLSCICFRSLMLSSAHFRTYSLNAPANLGFKARPFVELSTSFLQVPSTNVGCSPSLAGFASIRERHSSQTGGKVRAKGKGFGELLQKKKKGGSEGEKSERTVCPCGGGEERREYSTCCARYHGGVIEPDTISLMKARFSAYSLGIVPYIVRTTHPDNPDFEGEQKLTDDVRATCERLRFTKLDIIESENNADDEAFVSFRVTYSMVKGGRGGDRKLLVEKSRFEKVGDRWLYRERIPLSQASEATWLASTTPHFADVEAARKAITKTKPQSKIAM